MIKGVKFVTIQVEDQQRALKFYTEKLGFTISTDQPFNDEQRWIELAVPGAETKLVLWKGKPGGFAASAFWTDSVQKTYEELTARGVEFTSPPKKESWGTSSIFKDSEGTAFVISSK